MFLKKNVLITGGSRGIGLAIVRAFAHRGANVYFIYQKSDEIAKNILSELNGNYPDQNFQAIKCDISDFDEIKQKITELANNVGEMDILINNAGIAKDANMLTLTKEDWDKVINTNLNGYFNTIKSVLFSFMKRKYGCIINITSISGIYGNAGQTNYAASKAGIIGLTLSLAKEIGPLNIRVNAIAPGFIETEMSHNLLQKRSEEMKKQISLRRIGKPEEIAEVACFIASDAASYMTGQVIGVDGGLII
ncbi:MAG: 3-oxoacyl-[acyl-carrier-protein] reductase [Spirochaetales bacterium]|nr:3-oxoacyl-[acyl-carrier-protein] reductase [Spirochaetales bacterium]